VSPDEEAAIGHSIRALDLDTTVRLTYEDGLETLIVKLMPSLAHESTAWTFFSNVLAKIAALPGHSVNSVVATGATRFNVPGQGSKEADAGIRPVTRGRDAWPSVVFEVGYSETLAALRTEARWWLLNSAGQTKMVIIIKISENPFSLHLECWGMIPNPTGSGRHTRRNPLTIPAATQSLDIDGAGAVSPPGTLLQIPYMTIFDIPHPNAADITFSANELSAIALHIYQMLT
jgi:hypothetical protein